jgi:hypothetical protein
MQRGLKAVVFHNYSSGNSGSLNAKRIESGEPQVPHDLVEVGLNAKRIES